MASTQSSSEAVQPAGSKGPSVLYNARCWRYEVVDGSVLAKLWPQQNRGIVCEIEVRRPKPPKEFPYICTIKQVKSGNGWAFGTSGPQGEPITFELEKGVVKRVRDSTRFFLILLGAVRVGIGLYSRTDSEAFSRIVLQSSHEDALDYAGEPESSNTGSESSTPKICVDESLSCSASATATEADSKSTASDESSIRGEVPEVQVDRSRIRTRRALSRATPSKSPQFLSMTDGDNEEATTVVLKTASSPKASPVVVPLSSPTKLSAATTTTTTTTPSSTTTTTSSSTESTEEKEKDGDAIPENPRVIKWNRRRLEDFSQDQWRKHKKHVFIVSTSGKPVYSRFGDEQNLAPFMASLMAMVSFIEDRKDSLKYFVAGELQVVFLLRGPLIFVILASTSEDRMDLVRQLFYICTQVLSILTYSSVAAILSSRADYDLRDLLSPTDHVLIDNLCHLMNHNIGYMTSAFEPLKLPAATRQEVSNIMLKRACPELLYAFLFCENRLIQCARPRRFTLDPVDYHVLVNFVRNSTSARSVCTWTPICLPMFDEKGFLHALIYYVTSDVLIVLLSTKVDAYYCMAGCAQSLEKDLWDSHAMETIAKEASEPSFSLSSLGPEFSSIYHFMFRSTHLRQVIYPTLEGRYASPTEQKRLLRVYQKARQNARNSISSCEVSIANAIAGVSGEAQSQVFYQISEHETVVSFITRKFELYVTLSATESKSLAMKSCLALLQWISSHESELFIQSFPMWP